MTISRDEPRPHELTEAEVWARVKEFAQSCKDRGRALYTLNKGIRNEIANVHPRRIERVSAGGTEQTGHITEGQIHRLWTELQSRQPVAKGSWNYFALPLIQGALPELIEDLGDGTIVLVGAPPRPRAPAYTYWYDELESEAHEPRARASTDDEGQRGSAARGEGASHWRLKHYIAAHPDDALRELDGGPWTRARAELTLRLPTSDRADVFLREGGSRRPLFVEVKPRVEHGDFNVYAQVAKYRVIWQVLHNLDHGHVRCAIAAPRIPRELARHMRERFAIESVEVRVPQGYRAPPRPREDDAR